MIWTQYFWLILIGVAWNMNKSSFQKNFEKLWLRKFSVRVILASIRTSEGIAPASELVWRREACLPGSHYEVVYRNIFRISKSWPSLALAQILWRQWPPPPSPLPLFNKIKLIMLSTFEKANVCQCPPNSVYVRLCPVLSAVLSGFYDTPHVLSTNHAYHILSVKR